MSPLVYKLAKYVIVSNVHRPGAPLHQRVQQRPELYGRVRAELAEYLERHPHSTALQLSDK